MNPSTNRRHRWSRKHSVLAVLSALALVLVTPSAAFASPTGSLNWSITDAPAAGLHRGGGTWEGAVSDMATDTVLHIGTWTLAEPSLLSPSHVAWAERYLDGYNCTLSQIPYFNVDYRSPIGWSSTGTQYNGTLSAAREGGPCTGEQGFATSGSGALVNVRAGS
ncbi:hypothetical protein [Actinomadura gamaensis]|uniref:Uncharacterized protein n=1 Tax=Actinomadura gamaensis TaxID=1763541 RepID=A0ABV9U0I9_9ACTN